MTMHFVYGTIEKWTYFSLFFNGIFVVHSVIEGGLWNNFGVIMTIGEDWQNDHIKRWKKHKAADFNGQFFCLFDVQPLWFIRWNEVLRKQTHIHRGFFRDFILWVFILLKHVSCGAFKVTPWPFMTHNINTGTNEGEKEEAAKRETLNRNLISLHDCFVTLIRVLFSVETLIQNFSTAKFVNFLRIEKVYMIRSEFVGVFFSAHAERLTKTLSAQLVWQNETRISIFDGKSIKIILKLNTSLNIWIDSIRYWTEFSAWAECYSQFANKATHARKKKSSLWRQFVE